MDTVQIPHDVYLEKACLAVMLSFPGDLLDGRDLLTLEDFHVPAHRTILRSMVGMSACRLQVDAVTLADHMRGDRLLEDIGGIGYLLSLDETLPMRGAVKQYAGSLKELAARRRLHAAAYHALTAAEQGTASQEILSALDDAMAEVRAQGDVELITAAQAVERVNGSLQPGARVAPIATGIDGLDARTMGGIRPGELWIVGALPGRGKSTLARQITHHAAAAGTPSLVFSLEMTCAEWFGIDQATQARIEPWKLRQVQYLTAAERAAMLTAGESMSDLPLYFDESSTAHVDRMVSKARLAVLRHGVRLVVVDYAQRVEGNGRELRNRVGYVAQRLAEFAKHEKVAVLLLSQLRRPSEINARPSMADLKESGDLEAHAHTVILAYQPVDRETDKPIHDRAELIVGKQRFGPLGTVPVVFDDNWLCFRSRAGERSQAAA